MIPTLCMGTSPKSFTEHWALESRHLMTKKWGTFSSLLISILHTAAILPKSGLGCAIFSCIPALATLFAVAPETLVHSAVWPCKDSEAVLLVRDVVPAVLAPSGPHIAANAVDHGIFPLALEAAAIACKVKTISADDIVPPGALIAGAIDPAIATVAIFLTLRKGPFISSTLNPCLNSIAILEVVAPLPSVCGASFVVVNAHAAGHVLVPLANVNVTVAVREASLSNCEVVLPLALICRSIRPCLLSESIPHVVVPLASVSGATFEAVRLPVLHAAASRLQLHELFQLPVEVRGRLLQVILLGFEILLRIWPCI
mmetsp:Transcript_83315/g.144771  ORF Transcript_83315/g.144771 Transcript_83315/m.144771 type:complete len:314 (-) Transcript_83315:144-1085(-)